MFNFRVHTMSQGAIVVAAKTPDDARKIVERKLAPETVIVTKIKRAKDNG